MTESESFLTQDVTFLFFSAVFLLVAGLILTGKLRDRFHEVSIWDYETALLFRFGERLKALEPGRHRYFGHGYSVLRFDTRFKELVVAGQEILTQDKASIRLTLVATYRLVDAVRFHEATATGEQPLYTRIQLALRELVGRHTLDDLLEGKAELTGPLTELTRPLAEQLGLELSAVEVRDLILSGDLKRAYAAVIQSRKEALAELEKARGQAAKIRTLANAARLMENHPQLLQLRYLETLTDTATKHGNTVVFASPEEWVKAKSVTAD